MKKILTIVGILGLAAVIAVPVMAQGPGWGRGARMAAYWGGGGQGYCWNNGAGYGNLTDEQGTQLDNLYKKFYDNTADTRNQLWTKRGELNALLSSPNPDPEKAKALQKDINDLRAKLSQDRLALDLEVQKINPNARYGGWGPGAGYGRGMMGYGYGPMGGYGPGMMGYGYGHMGGYGPGMMGYGYGPMGGHGPGMMGYGYGHMGGYGPGMMGYGYGPMGGYGPGASSN
jgi:Spy/CpxP family protein refolding chaperone